MGADPALDAGGLGEASHGAEGLGRRPSPASAGGEERRGLGRALHQLVAGRAEIGIHRLDGDPGQDDLGAVASLAGDGQDPVAGVIAIIRGLRCQVFADTQAGGQQQDSQGPGAWPVPDCCGVEIARPVLGQSLGGGGVGIDGGALNQNGGVDCHGAISEGIGEEPGQDREFWGNRGS